MYDLWLDSALKNKRKKTCIKDIKILLEQLGKYEFELYIRWQYYRNI